MASFIAFYLALAVGIVSAYDSKFDLSAAERYVTFSLAAYCADPVFVKNKIDNWSCKACAKYPHVNATAIHGTITDANGYIAYDYDANEIIVAFAGTDPLSIQNWIDDLNFLKTNYPYCSNNCQVHQGFYKSFKSIRDKIYSTLNSYIAQHPTATIAVTGHSLGAAMAAHGAADLTQTGYKIKTVYAYGMPRVGDEAFEKWYVSTLPGTFRLVHDHDPVPHLAPESFGFHHMPYEVFYVKDYKQYTVCSADGEDKNCSDKYIADLNVVDHTFYLQEDFISGYLSCQV